MKYLQYKDRKVVLQLAENRLTELLRQRTSLVDPFVPYDLYDFAEDEQPLYAEANRLCEKLWRNKPIDLMHYLGLENDYSLKNQPLVTFVMTTRYERIAMHLAYLMKLAAIEAIKAMRYRPAQDYLADLFLPEFMKALFQPKNETEIPPELYVETILHALQTIDKHLMEGKSLKLSQDEIILHDELCGVFMDCFIDKEIKVAKQLHRLLWKDSHFALTDSMRKDMLKVNLISIKTLCNDHYPDGRNNEDMSDYYLAAHAEDVLWCEKYESDKVCL